MSLKTSFYVFCLWFCDGNYKILQFIYIFKRYQCFHVLKSKQIFHIMKILTVFKTCYYFAILFNLLAIIFMQLQYYCFKLFQVITKLLLNY